MSTGWQFFLISFVSYVFLPFDSHYLGVWIFHWAVSSSVVLFPLESPALPSAASRRGRAVSPGLLSDLPGTGCRQWAVCQHPLPYHERKIMIHFFLKPELRIQAWGKQQGGRDCLPELLLLLLPQAPKNKNLAATVMAAVWAPGIFQQKLNFHQKQTYTAIIWGHWCYHCTLQV